ncbi:hypothetical protein Agabi119p4_7563 [Agaricus bisporus var. burnettii]|uniref:GST N-terminal domain-containing protein n=1 Tax=Agaricus bisporus var. burnettii TaxID=192524 RepID=A0A8H7EZM7_AGABI|nr:hypothetical protein Agabi119p4_7563 [Agaricus bisporus var. burnettii]
MITLYDLAAKDPIKTWSLNVWKVRYILNLKKLPYKTVHLEIPDIASVLEEANVPPTVKQDGSLGYTVPSIVDDTTGIAVSDSFKIAEYLDKQYPDTPQAFPSGSIALQAAFYAQFSRLTRGLSPLIITKIPNILNPVSFEHFHQTHKGAPGGHGLVAPTGEQLEEFWRKAKDMFDVLDGFYAKSSGPFCMGEIPSFADFILGGVFQEMKILGDGDRIMGLNDGRWERLRVDLEQYASTEN